MNYNNTGIPMSAKGIDTNALMDVSRFSSRLKLVIGDESIRSFAKRCTLSAGTVMNYLSGDSYPTLDRLVLISTSANINLTWLVTGIEPPPVKTEGNSGLSKINNGLVNVPQYDLRASAGNGSLVVSEEPVAQFSFSENWLMKQGLEGEELSVVPVSGDSMEPTLVDEDLMLVKMIDDPKNARDGVCVIRVDDEILVKRIQYDFMKEGYHVTSDNSAYSPFFVGKEYHDRFKVIGRMVRVLQRSKMKG
ncbi:Prophage MuSo2, transcriptional regulator, Cro/CI family [Moritella viscosa]|uniref:Prophage MuSo2, transcriptional regulator, Cro/CI family n=2 Tax=Moritella viscosa TaxID=80854 RepID=A0A1L0C754_9GAMM|nr:Prophage MuSo2, transcriptional regulator, Cro/CI family [Moritella viscosa]